MKPAKRFRVIRFLTSQLASWRNVARNSFLASCNLNASFPPLLLQQSLSDDAYHPVVKAVGHESRHQYRWFRERTHCVFVIRSRRRAAAYVVEPCSMSLFTVASPIPAEAPVTTATLLLFMLLPSVLSITYSRLWYT